jgi:hypothetical protein
LTPSWLISAVSLSFITVVQLIYFKKKKWLWDFT